MIVTAGLAIKPISDGRPPKTGVATRPGSASGAEDLPDHRPGRMDGSSRSNRRPPLGPPGHGPARPPREGEVRLTAAAPPAGTRRDVPHRDGFPASSAGRRPAGS